MPRKSPRCRQDGGAADNIFNDPELRLQFWMTLDDEDTPMGPVVPSELQLKTYWDKVIHDYINRLFAESMIPNTKTELNKHLTSSTGTAPANASALNAASLAVADALITADEVGVLIGDHLSDEALDASGAKSLTTVDFNTLLTAHFSTTLTKAKLVTFFENYITAMNGLVTPTPVLLDTLKAELIIELNDKKLYSDLTAAANAVSVMTYPDGGRRRKFRRSDGRRKRSHGKRRNDGRRGKGRKKSPKF